MEGQELQMTDDEYEVMDELYFVISYTELCSHFSEDILIKTLRSLYEKGWIRVLKTEEADEDDELIEWGSGLNKYFFLASKRGLFAHNSN